jgi:hypothetical protein
MENDVIYDDQDKELLEATKGLKGQDGSLDEENYDILETCNKKNPKHQILS